MCLKPHCRVNVHFAPQFSPTPSCTHAAWNQDKIPLETPTKKRAPAPRPSGLETDTKRSRARGAVFVVKWNIKNKNLNKIYIPPVCPWVNQLHLQWRPLAACQSVTESRSGRHCFRNFTECPHPPLFFFFLRTGEGQTVTCRSVSVSHRQF